MTKELLFSVTAKDCDWEYIRGTGAGGQKRNKTSSKVRCTHRASGAVAVDDTTRSQHQNKRNAFRKMAESAAFKAWHKVECAKRMGQMKSLEEIVDSSMSESNLLVEGRDNGKWAALSSGNKRTGQE